MQVSKFTLSSLIVCHKTRVKKNTQDWSKKLVEVSSKKSVLIAIVCQHLICSEPARNHSLTNRKNVWFDLDHWWNANLGYDIPGSHTQRVCLWRFAVSVVNSRGQRPRVDTLSPPGEAMDHCLCVPQTVPRIAMIPEAEPPWIGKLLRHLMRRACRVNGHPGNSTLNKYDWPMSTNKELFNCASKQEIIFQDDLQC